MFITEYNSPLGVLILTADNDGLTGLWSRNGKNAPSLSDAKRHEKLPVFVETKRWLDKYFGGEAPEFLPKLHMTGTDFQMRVWNFLLDIPYGKTTTYGAIAKRLINEHGYERMSAQAVGGAVGRNNISIIVPCHRVIGADGSLTGYAGGLDMKKALLRIEGILPEGD